MMERYTSAVRPFLYYEMRSRVSVLVCFLTGVFVSKRSIFSVVVYPSERTSGEEL